MSAGAEAVWAFGELSDGPVTQSTGVVMAVKARRSIRSHKADANVGSVIMGNRSCSGHQYCPRARFFTGAFRRGDTGRSVLSDSSGRLR